MLRIIHTKHEWRAKSLFSKLALRPFAILSPYFNSKAKIPTIFGNCRCQVSFQEVVRTFGDDAVSSAAKGVGKTPMAGSLSSICWCEMVRALHMLKLETDSLPAKFFTLALGKNFSGVSEAQRRSDET